MIGNGLDSRIGEKDDKVIVPHVLGDGAVLAYLTTAYYHVHGLPFVYPDHADTVLLTAGGGAWNLAGNIIEVIPANVLDVESFDLHWINIADISANGEVQVDIFKGLSGNEVWIGATRSQRNAVQSRENANRIQVAQQLVNERISCRLSDSTAGALTCRVSFEGHYYSD